MLCHKNIVTIERNKPVPDVVHKPGCFITEGELPSVGNHDNCGVSHANRAPS
jgi:hypothetical protein